MDSKASETSPARAAIEELQFFRQNFRTTVESYATKVEAQIAHLQEIIHNQAGGEKIPAAKLRDLRDILTVLRNLEVRPEKGRRKDLKKMDLLVADLVTLLENW